MKRLLLLGLSALFAIALTSPAAATGGGTVPAGSHANGASLLKQGERWTAWAFGSSTNPLLNDICGEKVGRSFFLNVPIEPGTTELNCRIPPGTPLLATPGGLFCNAEPGQTDADVLACLDEFFVGFTDPKASLDGRALDVGDVLRSGVFTVPLEEGNFLQTLFPETPYGDEVRAAYEAWFLRIRPLTPGRHVVVISDRIDGELFEMKFHIKVGKCGRR